MKLLRRQLLRLLAGAAALPAVSRIALALDYPTRPVHVIVGYPPGSGPDIEGRLIAQWLSERLGQPFRSGISKAAADFTVTVKVKAVRRARRRSRTTPPLHHHASRSAQILR